MATSTIAGDDPDMAKDRGPNVRMRIPPAELDRWRAGAGAAGLTLTEYIRRRVNSQATVTLEAGAPPSRPTKHGRKGRG